MLTDLIVRFMELLAKIESKKAWVIQKIEEWQVMPKGSNRYQAAMQLQKVLSDLTGKTRCIICGKCIYDWHPQCEARILTTQQKVTELTYAKQQPPLEINPKYQITWAEWVTILETFLQEPDL